MDSQPVGGVMESQAPCLVKAMRFTGLRLFKMLRSSRPLGNGDGFKPYEPWVCDAFERFEREIEAFCRRSLFSVIV